MNFIIELYCTQNGCIEKELTISVQALSEIKTILKVKVFEKHHVYDLSAQDIAHINKTFNLNIDPQTSMAKIRHEIDIDKLPYLVHTGRELYLMLNKNKPLSVFVEKTHKGHMPKHIPELFFEPYVKSGQLVQYKHLQNAADSDQTVIHTILYALPHEQWRIKAYMLLYEIAEKTSWNEGFERMEGRLLGYTETQNDAYIKLLQSRSGTV